MQVLPVFSRSLKYIAVFSLFLLGAAAARADQPGAGGPKDATGWWVVSGGNGAIYITTCGTQLCGNLEWLRVPLEQGKPKTDKNNPDQALRARLLCGLPVMGNFNPDGQGGWEDGWAYDPTTGKTYKTNLHVGDDGKLHVHGYIGIPLIGLTKIMTRPATPLQHCVVGSVAAQPAGAAPAQ
jgi:uncharacterized protein (DUF2147 family)